MNLEIMENPPPSHSSQEDVEKGNSNSYAKFKHSASSTGQSRHESDTINSRTPNDPAEATSILSLHSRETGEEAVHGPDSTPSPSSGGLASHNDENPSVAHVQETGLLLHSVYVDPVPSPQPYPTVESSTEPFPDYYESCEKNSPVIDKAHEDAYASALSQELLYSRQREAEYLHSSQREVETESAGDPLRPPSTCPGQSSASTGLLTEASPGAHPENTPDCQAARARTPEQVSGPNDGQPSIPAAATGGSPVSSPSTAVTQSNFLGSGADPNPELDPVVSPAKSQNQIDSMVGGDASPEPEFEDDLSPEPASQDEVSAQIGTALGIITWPDPAYEDEIDSTFEDDTSPGPEYLLNTDIMSYIPTPGADDECQNLLEEMRRLLQNPRVLNGYRALYGRMSTNVLTVSHHCLRRLMMTPNTDYAAFLRPADIESLSPSLNGLWRLAHDLLFVLRQELENVDNAVREAGSISREGNLELIERFSHVADTIIKRFYVVQPVELHIFAVFYDFFFAWLFDDFSAFRTAQRRSETILEPDRIAVTGTMEEIRGFLNCAWDCYHILAESGNRMTREVLIPMATPVPNGVTVWNNILNWRRQIGLGQ